MISGVLNWLYWPTFAQIEPFFFHTLPPLIYTNSEGIAWTNEDFFASHEVFISEGGSHHHAFEFYLDYPIPPSLRSCPSEVQVLYIAKNAAQTASRRCFYLGPDMQSHRLGNPACSRSRNQTSRCVIAYIVTQPLIHFLR